MNYISNIDTLYFLVDIEDYENTCKKVLDFLKNEKEIALCKFEQNKSIHITVLNSMQFQINHSGTKGYEFIIRNDYFELCIAKYRSPILSFKPIKIRISSEALWSIGFLQSYETIKNWITSTFGRISAETVYRIDLCNHSNVDYISDYKNAYKGNFKKQVVTYSGKNINALCFGSRNNKLIYCRIYNKTLEITETKRKTWFKEIWKNYNLDMENVWNLEFEIKSEFLRSKNLVTVYDVYEHLQDLWRYCTEDWLVKINNDNVRKTRCSINSNWLEIQNAFYHFKSNGLISNNSINDYNASILIPAISGFITSYSANKKVKDINSALDFIKSDTQKYLKSKNTTFSEVVQNKILAKGEMQNG